ncbi:MAG: UDP-N-acetylmuramoyl-tripeptide--D-alanyl-D-alanine ligase [Coleofasciculaceae cyanobacterium]
MSCQVSLTKLIDILAAKALNISAAAAATSCTAITTDTRGLQPGNLFVALRGENFDGHDFARMAVEKGAIAVISDSHSATQLDGVPQLQVEDTLVAYQQIARWWREQFNIPVIAITGSVGKTTTKELIAAVLSTSGKVLKTQGNYNNEIGVPKTLLEMGAEHDYAVIELAMRGSGQIALLTQLVRPTVSVITNVGTAHIGLLGSEQAIAEAKCELLAEMPITGTAILNHDDQRLMQTAAWQGETVTYGLDGGDLQGTLIDNQTLEVQGVKLPLPLAGRHNALNYVGALAVAKVLRVDWTPLAEGLGVELPSGRSQRYDLPNDLVVLDETYNAGLESMLAALQLLAQTPGARHIAVLGTMKELGERSVEFHQRVGQLAQQLELDALLILVDDPEANAIAQGAGSSLSECFSSHDTLLRRLEELVQPGDRLLFKASRSVGLDRVVKQFLVAIAV